MQVTEEQRRALYERLRERLGEDVATLLLEVAMPANVEIATHADVQELRGEFLLRFAEFQEFLSARLAALEGRMAGVDERLASVDQRFTSIDQRFTSIDQRFTSIDQRITTVDQRIAGVDQRIAGVETGITGLGIMLKGQLYKVVIPTLATLQLLLLALSQWVLR